LIYFRSMEMKIHPKNLRPKSYFTFIKSKPFFAIKMNLYAKLVVIIIFVIISCLNFKKGRSQDHMLNAWKIKQIVY
jgi:hypothetical protein